MILHNHLVLLRFRGRLLHPDGVYADFGEAFGSRPTAAAWRAYVGPFPWADGTTGRAQAVVLPGDHVEFVSTFLREDKEDGYLVQFPTETSMAIAPISYKDHSRLLRPVKPWVFSFDELESTDSDYSSPENSSKNFTGNRRGKKEAFNFLAVSNNDESETQICVFVSNKEPGSAEYNYFSSYVMVDPCDQGGPHRDLGTNLDLSDPEVYKRTLKAQKGHTRIGLEEFKCHMHEVAG
ncbi:hypothetical protein BJ508DRAFT_310341 [Ascobolus immersus RN42]|uniref:Uncharacterized protein n=1 Tax=Ascobolus immersus RN42 TaxID=1160509 RepID=A0A3N4HTT5_ASCIM|nr:hypothetical protein BJ508DRAFT_310341 [Ascobolus immersus RN42]